MKIKHVNVSLPELHALAKQERVPEGVNIFDWYLNNHAPGRLVGVTSFVQPIKLSPLDPQPVMAPVFHFFFETMEVLAS